MTRAGVNYDPLEHKSTIMVCHLICSMALTPCLGQGGERLLRRTTELPCAKLTPLHLLVMLV